VSLPPTLKSLSRCSKNVKRAEKGEKVSSRFLKCHADFSPSERKHYLWHEHINIFIIVCISFWIFSFSWLRRSRVALEESYNLEALFLIICVFLIDFFSGGISRGFQCFTWLRLLYLVDAALRACMSRVMMNVHKRLSEEVMKNR
jgi:hypothetical protein